MEFEGLGGKNGACEAAPTAGRAAAVERKRRKSRRSVCMTDLCYTESRRQEDCDRNSGLRRGGLSLRREHPREVLLFERADAVAELGSFLKFEFLGGFAHLGLEP